MRKTLIFVGPTLYGVNFRRKHHEIYLPPAEQGDLLRGIARYAPGKIVLIDGTFNQSLSVWQKECIFALVDGVTLIGASSMGALRAAECDRYGMIGVGRIYEDYKSTRISDDGYVAMTYDPETFRPLSEPPCGLAQKQIDALAAIELARDKGVRSIVTLSKEQVKSVLTPVFDRILEDDLLIYGR
jgi:hypothetical protein